MSISRRRLQMVSAVATGCCQLQDSACLRQAARQGLTFVTYDRRTIPPLLKIWAEEERKHGGVIFVDEKTILPSDTGGLVRASRKPRNGTGPIESASCAVELAAHPLARMARSSKDFYLVSVVPA